MDELKNLLNRVPHGHIFYSIKAYGEGRGVVSVFILALRVYSFYHMIRVISATY